MQQHTNHLCNERINYYNLNKFKVIDTHANSHEKSLRTIV